LATIRLSCTALPTGSLFASIRSIWSPACWKRRNGPPAIGCCGRPCPSCVLSDLLEGLGKRLEAMRAVWCRGASTSSDGDPRAWGGLLGFERKSAGTAFGSRVCIERSVACVREFRPEAGQIEEYVLRHVDANQRRTQNQMDDRILKCFSKIPSVTRLQS
jgi:hypothetical protein